MLFFISHMLTLPGKQKSSLQYSLDIYTGNIPSVIVLNNQHQKI